MTFGDKAEERRAKVGTKVLAFGFAIFAVLGSFWTIVWFIRSYVEPPRVTISPALALASLDSKPVPPPTPTAAPEPTGSISQPKPAVSPATAEAVRPGPSMAQATPAEPNAAGSIADRWAPMASSPAPEPAPAAAPQPETAAAPAAPSAEPPEDEIAESSVPAISGPAPAATAQTVADRRRARPHCRTAAAAPAPRRPGAAERVDSRAQ